MKLKIAIVAVAFLLMGAAYAAGKPFTDKPALAGHTDSGVELSTPAPLATPDPSFNDDPTGQTLGEATAPASDPAPAGTPAAPAATPFATPAPTAIPTPTASPTPTPLPTPVFTPLPTPIRCGGCPKPYPKTDYIMCPQLESVYCAD